MFFPMTQASVHYSLRPGLDVIADLCNNYQQSKDGVEKL